MKTKYSRSIAVVILILFAVSSFASQPAQASSFSVIPPTKVSYADWGGKWWAWAFSIPQTDNPLMDTTGANCGVGQSGSVWFLAGVWNISSTQTRSCTIPKGKALFFPVLTGVDVEPLATTLTFSDILNSAIYYTGTPTKMGVVIDGVRVANLKPGNQTFYAQSSKFFYVTLPDNNLFQSYPGDPAAPAGDYEGATAGYWLMLAPLSAGSHTIRFFATSNIGGSLFRLDVIYNLTISN